MNVRMQSRSYGEPTVATECHNHTRLWPMHRLGHPGRMSPSIFFFHRTLTKTAAMIPTPKYTRDREEEEELLPLYHTKHLGPTTNVDAVPSTSAGVSGEAEVERSNITYTFIPRYPVKGDRQDALGVLGLNKEVCMMDIARCSRAALSS